MADQSLARASVAFAFRLLGEARREARGNVFLSPLSVMLAVALAANGAAGTTLRGVLEALDCGDLSLDALNAGLADLAAALQSDPQVQLAIANSLWGNQQVTFDADYLARCRRFYGAEISALDFGAPDALERINGWVSQQTRGTIPSIISGLSPLDVLVLINAIFFKGDWSRPFDAEETVDHPFTCGDGRQAQVRLMQQDARLRYTETAEFQLVALPYGGGALSMYVLLPPAGTALGQAVAGLNPASWQAARAQLHERQGLVGLPRFTLSYELDISNTLIALGMEEAFSPGRADFSPMSPQAHALGFHIDRALHKTFLEVDEQGTTAAAVTAIVARALSIDPDPPFHMVVDRPFLCAIGHEPTGALLFLGTITELG